MLMISRGIFLNASFTGINMENDASGGDAIGTYALTTVARFELQIGRFFLRHLAPPASASVFDGTVPSSRSVDSQMPPLRRKSKGCSVPTSVVHSAPNLYNRRNKSLAVRDPTVCVALTSMSKRDPCLRQNR